MSEYFAEIQRRVKRNWNPSQAVEEYTTELAFDIASQASGVTGGIGEALTSTAAGLIIARQSVAGILLAKVIRKEFKRSAKLIEFKTYTL